MERRVINDEDPSFDRKDCSYEGIYNIALDGNSEKNGSGIEDSDTSGDSPYVLPDIRSPDYD
jgi:hypothetical protein